MALIEIDVNGAQIEIRAWPILVAHLDLAFSAPQSIPRRDVVATPAHAHPTQSPAWVQPIREKWRHQVDHSVTAISRAWLGHVLFLQPVH